MSGWGKVKELVGWVNAVSHTESWCYLRDLLCYVGMHATSGSKVITLHFVKLL